MSSTSRIPLVAGNWKMHFGTEETVSLITQMLPALEKIEGVECVLCPAFPSLQAAHALVRDTRITLGAQDVHWEDEGAYTGEVSPLMLREFCRYVIVGHSERRQLLRETDQDVQKKVHAALRHGLKPILAVGETIEERKAGKTEEVVESQLRLGLQGVTSDQAESLIVAYEPIWAIGTGLAATPEEANRTISTAIRKTLAVLLGGKAAKDIRVLYGGSVKPENASDFFTEQAIDGALVGGASLNPESFVRIVAAASS